MLKHAVILLGLLTIITCEEARKHKYEDPFTALDRQLSHTLAYHYLWPFSQLVKAAAALDTEENLEEPYISSDPKKFEVKMLVRSFKPDELRVKVKNRYVIVEGKHNLTNDKNIGINHFVQRFVLPPGTKQEEVTAVLNEKGVLIVTAPKHELPPPLPEREVPIEVKIPEQKKSDEKSEKPIDDSEDKIVTSTEKKVEELPSSSATPLEQLDLVEVTTHVGKIRKKELKSTVKTAKNNEVIKGGDNALDYASIDSELE